MKLSPFVVCFWLRVALCVPLLSFALVDSAAGDNYVQLWARNGLTQPLIDQIFPHYPNVAAFQVTILTDHYTTPGPHSVTVVNDDPPGADGFPYALTPLNVTTFYFNVVAGGKDRERMLQLNLP